LSSKHADKKIAKQRFYSVNTTEKAKNMPNRIFSCQTTFK